MKMDTAVPGECSSVAVHEPYDEMYGEYTTSKSCSSTCTTCGNTQEEEPPWQVSPQKPWSDSLAQEC